MTVLEAIGLSLTRGHREDRFKLSVEALVLKAGEMVSVHGPSGKGKSSLLELLACVVRPDAAERLVLTPQGKSGINLDDAVMDHGPLRSGPIGYGPQSGGLLGFLSAGANARAALALTGRDREPKLNERFDRLVDDLGLGECLDRNRGALSGGERKRVALLRALAVPRTLLVLDEPTAGLDDALADRAMNAIAQVCSDDGTALVAAMHDQERSRRFGLARLTLKPCMGGAFLPWSTGTGI